MAEVGATFVGNWSKTLGMRRPRNIQASAFADAVCRLLTRKYPAHTARQVAADLTSIGLGEVTVKSAENLLLGHLSGKTMTRLAVAYGPGFFLEASAEAAGTTIQDYIVAEKERARHERETWEARERELRSLETAVGCSGAESRRGVRSPGL